VLRETLGQQPGSVVDVSAARTTLELAGPRARDVLEHGCALDLHPRAFGPGQCAQTLLAKANVVLHQVDDAPTYRLLVRPSFARYLVAWLLDAMTESTAGAPA
jgi:sarcosine oxidase subunit gamma